MVILDYKGRKNGDTEVPNLDGGVREALSSSHVLVQRKSALVHVFVYEDPPALTQPASPHSAFPGLS